MDAMDFAGQIELGAVLLAGVGLIAAVVVGVLLLTGRRVPWPVAPLALSLPALAVLAFTAGQPGPEADLAALTQDVTASVGNRLLLFFLLAPLGGLFLLFAAVAGARHAPRRAWVAGAGALGVLAVVVCAILGGYADLSPEFGWMRGGAYLITGLLTSAALLGGGKPEQPGRDAAPAAAVTWALLVAAGETSVRSLNELLLVLQAASMEAVHREAFVQAAFSDGTSASLPCTWAALGLAMAVGLLGVATSPGQGKRWLSAAMGLPLLGLVPALYLVGDVHPEVVTALVVQLP